MFLLYVAASTTAEQQIFGIAFQLPQ